MGQTDAYTDQESYRLSAIMYDNPHAAADELRNQLQQLDPQTASELIAKTKNNENVGGLGDLQIQVEFDQNGRDSGYRNVTMATPEGIEQIAELQSQPPAYYSYYGNEGNYNYNPLGYVAGVIVGDLLWQQRRGIDFDDDRYRGWGNRQQWRENDWNEHRDRFVQSWQDPDYRRQYQQNQNWQQNAFTSNNTYINNSRINTTIVNNHIDNTIINNTINNTHRGNNLQTGTGNANPYAIGRQQFPQADRMPDPNALRFQEQQQAIARDQAMRQQQHQQPQQQGLKREQVNHMQQQQEQQQQDANRQQSMRIQQQQEQQQQQAAREQALRTQQRQQQHQQDAAREQALHTQAQQQLQQQQQQEAARLQQNQQHQRPEIPHGPRK